MIDAFARAWRQAVWTGAGAIGAAAGRPPFEWPGTSALFFELGAWRDHLAQAWTLLDPIEQARVARRRRPLDRDELTLSYALHRLLLSQWMGCSAIDVPLQRDARGRPCVTGDALQTSLSHVAGYAAVAVGMHVPLGIDVEPRRRAAEMLEIADQVWHPDERQALATLPDAARGDALLQSWVRKEALLKAAGVGLAVAMPSFCAPTGVALPVPCEDNRDDGRRVQLQMLDAGPHWHAALASAAGDRPRLAWMWP